MGEGVSEPAMGAADRESFLALARELTELASTETTSHDALSKRVLHLETVLASARKELADVRVRNERLEKQLRVATAAREGEAVESAAPSRPPAAPAATGNGQEQPRANDSEGRAAADDAQAGAADGE